MQMQMQDRFSFLCDLKSRLPLRDVSLSLTGDVTDVMFFWFSISILYASRSCEEKERGSEINYPIASLSSVLQSSREVTAQENDSIGHLVISTTTLPSNPIQANPYFRQGNAGQRHNTCISIIHIEKRGECVRVFSFLSLKATKPHARLVVCMNGEEERTPSHGEGEKEYLFKHVYLLYVSLPTVFCEISKYGK